MGYAVQGWTITWARAAPSGFEDEAGVTVSATGAVQGDRAIAHFSPD